MADAAERRVARYGFAAASPSSDAPLIGASGAVAGVLGAYLAHVFGFLAGALVGLVMRAGSRAASNA